MTDNFLIDGAQPNSKKLELPLKIVGSSVFGRYPKISSEKTYNMFISDGWLVCLGGYQKVAQLQAKGQGRGIFQSIRGNFTIAVIDNNVYKIMPNLSFASIGNLETTTGEVSIDENLSQQICIVDGINAYIYNWSVPSGIVLQVPDGIIGTSLQPNYVCYHDTFFLFGNARKETNNTKWYAYQADPLGNPNLITYVSDQTFQVKPDYPLAVKRIPGQSSNVLVFGTTVCEVHTHIGSTDNYRRNSSISIDYGCLSVDTIAASDSYLAWLGVNEFNAPVIMLFNGQTATPISTDGIDYLMGTLRRPDLSTALFFRQDGHLFYLLTFYYEGTDEDVNGVYDPGDNLTLIYDFDTQKFFHASDQNLNFHPARQVAYFNNDLYFVSLDNGSLYRWNSDITAIVDDIPTYANEPFTLDDNFDPNLVYEMQRIRICDTIRSPKTTPFIAETMYMTIDQGNQPARYVYDCLIIMITESTFPVFPDTRIFSEDPDSVQVVPENAGVEDCDPTLQLPKIQTSLSRDGGVTYSNYFDRYLNPTGYRQNIMKWDRLGLANEFTPKFRFWSLDRFVIGEGVIKLFITGRGD